MVDVEKLRGMAAGIEPTMVRHAMYDALTELEQLRAENAELNHVIAQNQATYRANTAELRAGLAAMVDALPKCNEFDACERIATHVDAVKWGQEILYACDEHDDEHHQLPYVTQLRAALRLLGRATDSGESKT